MTLEEENKALKDLVLTLNSYIPRICYNCTYFESAGFSYVLEKKIGVLNTIEQQIKMTVVVVLS